MNKICGTFRLIALWALLFMFHGAYSQYFENPSFEGPHPNPNNSPPGWAKCTGSPDTQPDVWNVTQPPSDGASYLGIAWLPSWIERVWTELDVPLSADSCYHIEIDLAFYPQINYYGDLQITFPMSVRFFSSQSYCSEGTLIWESPIIDNLDWDSYGFTITPASDINNILLRSYYPNPGMPAEIGYLLLDNIRVITPPPIDFGSDTTLCHGETLTLDGGTGFASWEWQDGSSGQFYEVTETGTYWVTGTTQYGCTISDTIHVTVMQDIELGNDTIFCVGDTVVYNAGNGYSGYVWFNGSLANTISLWEPGEYVVWVLASDISGCWATDTVLVTIISNDIEVFLGADTAVCAGQTVLLNPGVYDEYLWQDGSTGPAYTATESGIYWVTVFGECGTDTDSIFVEIFPAIIIDLGADTAICHGETLLLDAGTGYISYLWQDGSDSPYYGVSGTGIYSVSVEDVYGCTGSGDIQVEVAEVAELPGDTMICSGSSINITVTGNFDSYLWSNGNTGNSIIIESGGLYWLQTAYIFGCESSDTINVDEAFLPDTELGADREACEGETVEISVEPGPYNYYWNGIEGSNSITIANSGPVVLCLENDCGQDCDSVLVSIYSLPVVALGADVLLMPGGQVTLDGGNGYLSYLWQNGSQERYLPVSYEDALLNQLYWVEVDDGHCRNSDTIYVESFALVVPDVITPNEDGKNDLFRPGENFSGIHDHKIIVMNRWGEKIWESSDFTSGWDAKVNGSYVSEGVYFWVLEISYGPGGLKQVLKGSLTVIR